MSENAGGRTPGGSQDEAVTRLVDLVVDLREKECLDQMRQLLASGSPPIELLEACIEGVRRVGLLFQQGEYFIAALIMAGEIMREATELLSPYVLRGQSRSVNGSVLLGTIKGDIHDLGKNLFALLLQSNGFVVVDLGVDVPPEKFLSRAQEVHPDLVGISCVLTLGTEQLRAAVSLLHTEGIDPRPPVIIGGTSVDEQIFRYVKADWWARDAIEGLKICRRLMEEKARP